jgi:uncharacterized membrane protein YhaH (DUF805 family)
MDNNSTDAASAGLIAGGIIVYVLFVLVIVAVFIWIYWRIFTKAGYNGALALLNLVPGIGPLICILILAFGRWPIEDQLAALGGGRPLPPAGPPPGSSVAPQ